MSDLPAQEDHQQARQARLIAIQVERQEQEGLMRSEILSQMSYEGIDNTTSEFMADIMVAGNGVTIRISGMQREGLDVRILYQRRPGPPATYQHLVDQEDMFVEVPLDSILEDSRTCGICWDDYSPTPTKAADDGEDSHTPTKLPCGHIYGYKCIKRAILEQGKCPIRCSVVMHSAANRPDAA